MFQFSILQVYLIFRQLFYGHISEFFTSSPLTASLIFKLQHLVHYCYFCSVNQATLRMNIQILANYDILNILNCIICFKKYETVSQLLFFTLSLFTVIYASNTGNDVAKCHIRNRIKSVKS